MIAYYFTAAVITFIALMIMIFCFENKKLNVYLLIIILVMTIANCGYISIALGENVREVLLANKLAYLGGCFVPPLTLFLVCTICNYKVKKWIQILIYAYSFFVYAMVLSTGFSTIYYESITLYKFMGITVFNQVNGPGRIFFNMILYGYMVIQIAILVYSLIKKKAVSRKNLWLLLALELINIISFIIGRAINPFFEVMPFLYAVDSIICLCLYFKGMGYNVRDNIIGSYVEKIQNGYIMFDNKLRYLGCTEVAEQLFPDLKKCVVDKKIEHIEGLKKVLDWINQYSNRLDEGFGYEQEDKHYECKVKRIWNKNRALGYLVEFSEDTDKWKYMNLITTYNQELEKMQLELSKKVGVQTAELKQQQKVINDMFTQTVKALSEAVDAKDRYTSGHSIRVAKYARMIAAKMGKTQKEQEEIYRAGLLHDVGKIRIPEEIINKPGKLTDEEYNTIKIHTVTGYHILRGISGSDFIATAAKYHHERYDGKGYPNGLKGENIPEVARILGVADSYDAMSSNRSYRQALPQEIVRAEILKCKGTQFDPVIADVMLELIDEDKEYTMKQDDSMNRSILIVDDEAINHKLIAHIMREEPMYQISSALSGEKALELLEENEYDLIMLDVMMPGMGGLETLKFIRKKTITPVVLMTGDKTLDTSKGFAELGCDDYITKPFLPLLIKEVVHNMTERIQVTDEK